MTAAAMEATAIFTGLPQKVEKESIEARRDIIKQLYLEKSWLRNATKSFNEFTDKISDRVDDYVRGIFPAISVAQEIDTWRWISGLIAGMLVLVVWLLLLGALCCGCCGLERASIPTIIMMVVLGCITSTLVWTVGALNLIIGGQSENTACFILDQPPDYPALTLLADQSYNGIISDILYDGASPPMPVGHVLHMCKVKSSTYKTFNLHKVFNFSKASNMTRWKVLEEKIYQLHVDLRDFQVLTPVLQQRMNALLKDLELNLTSLRMQLSGSVMLGDISSIADQLENVGSQIHDLNTANHLETLASRSRRLVISHIQPLQAHKESLVYHLTALELKLSPLLRQVNQSLSHLRALQYFIANQGNTIAQQYVNGYSTRLFNYIKQYGNYLEGGLDENVATCLPFWNIFNFSRNYLCKNIVNSLNGFWSSLVICLIVLLFVTPFSLKLMDLYRMERGHTMRSQSEESFNREGTPIWSTTGHQELTAGW